MNKKDEIRNKNIIIRITENEKIKIENNAKKLGLEVSNYGRQLMINGYVFQVTNTSESNEFTLDRKTLIGLANNLNQLTRYAHQTKTLPKLEELLEKIEKIIDT
jgi:uncharacterized protein YjfI (DUF2170 family)